MDSSPSVVLIVALVVCFGIVIFLSAAEAALLRISPVRAMSKADTSRGWRTLAGLVENLPNVLNAVLFAALLTQIGAATLAGLIAAQAFGSWGVTAASVGLTALLFVYGEAIPKTYAVRHPDRVGVTLAWPVKVLEIGLRPMVSILVWFADLQMPGKGIATAPTVTEAELRYLATSAASEGEITDEDAELIRRAFRIGDRRADDVMVPRPDVVAVSGASDVAEALELAIDSGHRRLPVFDGTIEHIDAMVRMRDLVSVPVERRQGLNVRVVSEQPLVVPASKRVLELLHEMQAGQTHLAVIVDEHGGTAGIVTIEDIAEELLGTMVEDSADSPVVAVGEGAWSIDAALPVEDLADLIREEVPEGPNTVGGLVMLLTGTIPSLGDVVYLGQHEIRVTSLRDRRVTRVEIAHRNDGPPPSSDRSISQG